MDAKKAIITPFGLRNLSKENCLMKKKAERHWKARIGDKKRSGENEEEK